MLTRGWYLLQETGRGLARGGWLNGAAISTVALLLFCLGLGLQTSWQLDELVTQFGNQVEVAVFLNPGVQAESLREPVAQLPEVAELQTITKDQAWEALRRDLDLPDLATIQEQLNGNPLVDELRVRAKQPEQVAALATKIKAMQGVEAVQFQPELVQQLQQLQRGLGTVSTVVIGGLVVTTIAVISTTIRLILVASRQEVEIMQLVGATSLWICGPFMVQGIGFGLGGGLLAWLCLVIGRNLLGGLVQQQPEFIQFLWHQSQGNPWEGILLFLILLLLGGGIGLLGSVLAVRDLLTPKGSS